MLVRPPCFFRKTLLRVGSPWASCGAAESYEGVGTILPLFLGHPNLEAPAYTEVASVVKAHTETPVYVVRLATGSSCRGASTQWVAYLVAHIRNLQGQGPKMGTAPADQEGCQECFGCSEWFISRGARGSSGARGGCAPSTGSKEE